MVMKATGKQEKNGDIKYTFKKQRLQRIATMETLACEKNALHH